MPTSADVEQQGDNSASNAAVADTTPARSLATSDDLARDLIDSMSEPSQHAIDQAQQATEVNQENLPDGFDASLHEIDANGKPILTPTGRFKKKSKNGKNGTARKSTLATGKAESAQYQAPNAETLARTSGAGAANLLLTFGMILGGEEWQPRVGKDYDEKAMLETAFADYFAATGKMDIPPGWALVACIGMYAAPRFTMPKTQGRLSRLKTWIGQKYLTWKLRKRGKSEDEITEAVAKQYRA